MQFVKVFPTFSSQPEPRQAVLVDEELVEVKVEEAEGEEPGPRVEPQRVREGPGPKRRAVKSKAMPAALGKAGSMFKQDKIKSSKTK